MFDWFRSGKMKVHAARCTDVRRMFDWSRSGKMKVSNLLPIVIGAFFAMVRPHGLG
jgi:hypothetical protein